MKKKLSALFLALAMILSLAACGSARKEEDVELIVFAAASLTETMDQIIENYKTVAPISPSPPPMIPQLNFVKGILEK